MFNTEELKYLYALVNEAPAPPNMNGAKAKAHMIIRCAEELEAAVAKDQEEADVSDSERDTDN